MTSSHRRNFMLQVVVASSALAASRVHAQAAGPKLEESDPQAMSLGYKQDSAKVDDKKFAKHEGSQTCANCQYFQGGAAAAGPCQIFAGKSVAAKGWCQVWMKKA